MIPLSGLWPSVKPFFKQMSPSYLFLLCVLRQIIGCEMKLFITTLWQHFSPCDEGELWFWLLRLLSPSCNWLIMLCLFSPVSILGQWVSCADIFTALWECIKKNSTQIKVKSSLRFGRIIWFFLTMHLPRVLNFIIFYGSAIILFVFHELPCIVNWYEQTIRGLIFSVHQLSATIVPNCCTQIFP